MAELGVSCQTDYDLAAAVRRLFLVIGGQASHGVRVAREPEGSELPKQRFSPIC